MPRLDSSAIRRVTYNPKTQKMNVKFVGTGKQYTYVGVPEDVYDDFIDASSAGQFFNDNIKDDYIAVPSEFVSSVRFDRPNEDEFYESTDLMELGLSVLTEQVVGDVNSFGGKKVNDNEMYTQADGSKVFAGFPFPKPRPKINYFYYTDSKGNRYIQSDTPYRNVPDIPTEYPVGGQGMVGGNIQREPFKPLPPTPQMRPSLKESPVALTMAGFRKLSDMLKNARGMAADPKYIPREVFRNKGQR
jgi:hypothetical protein